MRCGEDDVVDRDAVTGVDAWPPGAVGDFDTSDGWNDFATLVNCDKPAKRVTCIGCSKTTFFRDQAIVPAVHCDATRADAWVVDVNKRRADSTYQRSALLGLKRQFGRVAAGVLADRPRRK